MNAQESSTFKGTPGEWFAVNQDVRCGDPTGPTYIAIAWGDESHSPPFDEAVANALLIAAAPDLLAVLQTLVEYGMPWEYQVEADKAIAKALGQAVSS